MSEIPEQMLAMSNRIVNDLLPRIALLERRVADLVRLDGVCNDFDPYPYAGDWCHKCGKGRQDVHVEKALLLAAITGETTTR